MSSTDYFTYQQSAIPTNTNGYIFPDTSFMYPPHRVDATTIHQQSQISYPPRERGNHNPLYQANEALAALFAYNRSATHSFSSLSTDSNVDTQAAAMFDDSFTLAPMLAPLVAPYPLDSEIGWSIPYPQDILNPNVDYSAYANHGLFVSPHPSLPEVTAPAPVSHDLVGNRADALALGNDDLPYTFDAASAFQKVPTTAVQEIKPKEDNYFLSSSFDHDADRIGGGRHRSQRTRYSAPSPYLSNRPEKLAKYEGSDASLPTYLVVEGSESEGRRFIIPCLQPCCRVSCIGVEDLKAHLKEAHGISGSKSGSAKDKVHCTWATFDSPNGLVVRRQHLRTILQLLHITFRCRGSIAGKPCKRTCSRLEIMGLHWERDHGDREATSWDEVYQKKY